MHYGTQNFCIFFSKFLSSINLCFRGLFLWNNTYMALKLMKKLEKNSVFNWWEIYDILYLR